MNKQVLNVFLTEMGWQVVHMGNMLFTSVRVNAVTGFKLERKLRIKFQSKSVRVEVQVHHPDAEHSYAKNEWVRIGGDYYSRITRDGNIVRIGTYVFTLTEGAA